MLRRGRPEERSAAKVRFWVRHTLLVVIVGRICTQARPDAPAAPKSGSNPASTPL